MPETADDRLTAVDRVVLALDPSPATRAIVAAQIVKLASELDAETLDEIAAQINGAGPPGPLPAADVAARAGITKRQLHHWTQRGYLAPEPRVEGAGSGHVFRYPPATVVKARIMGSLVRLFTMAPGTASDLADEIIANGTAQVDGFTLTREGLTS